MRVLPVYIMDKLCLPFMSATVPGLVFFFFLSECTYPPVLKKLDFKKKKSTTVNLIAFKSSIKSLNQGGLGVHQDRDVRPRKLMRSIREQMLIPELLSLATQLSFR